MQEFAKIRSQISARVVAYPYGTQKGMFFNHLSFNGRMPYFTMPLQIDYLSTKNPNKRAYVCKADSFRKQQWMKIQKYCLNGEGVMRVNRPESGLVGQVIKGTGLKICNSS